MSALIRPPGPQTRASTRLSPVLRAVRALVVSAAFFAVAAVIVPFRHHIAIDLVYCVVLVGGVIVVARRWGPTLGVPLAIAAGLAIDSYVVAPTRGFGSQDWQNWPVVVVWLALGAVVGAIAARAQEQALTAEAARGRLADEQAALRRIATLVAREGPAEQVFDAVAEEVGRLLAVEWTRLVRPGRAGDSRVVAGWNADGETASRTPPSRQVEDVVSQVIASGGAVRSSGRSGEGGDDRQTLVGTPVEVDGRLWGVLFVIARGAQTLPPGTEACLAEFTFLIVMAIGKVEARTELAASRARLVVSSDTARRRVVRDLHDGAQQRLVNTVVALKLARRALSGEGRAAPMVETALTQAEQATAELRDLVHGTMPAALTRGGLRAAVDELAVRTPVPIERAVHVDRLPATVETTAYFVVAEALTNLSKYAHASAATVVARAEGDVLKVEIRDDGIGGAHQDGSGLVGLNDRVSALGGRLTVHSPPNEGTTVTATIPLDAY